MSTAMTLFCDAVDLLAYLTFAIAIVLAIYCIFLFLMGLI